MQAQYSSSVSPFQAKTGTPRGASGVPPRPTATAAAAWSWVEKMLQLAQRTSAPRSTRVSISTAVWMVMWSEPVIRWPASGRSFPVLAPERHQARHLLLGELDLPAPPAGEREILHLVLQRAGRGDCPGADFFFAVETAMGFSSGETAFYRASAAGAPPDARRARRRRALSVQGADGGRRAAPRD